MHSKHYGLRRGEVFARSEQPQENHTKNSSIRYVLDGHLSLCYFDEESYLKSISMSIFRLESYYEINVLNFWKLKCSQFSLGLLM